MNLDGSWHRTTFSFCALILGFVFIFSPSFSHASEKAIVKILLNSEDKGEYFIVLAPYGEILFTPEDLLEMGFKEVNRGSAVTIEGNDYIPLSSFSPAVRINLLDFQEAILYISVEPAILKKTTIDFSPRMPEDVVNAGKNSAFINYHFNYYVDNNLDLVSLNLPLETGININEYLFLSGFIYTKDSLNEDFVRLMSSITKDDKTAQRRIIAGDFSSSSGFPGGSGVFGGLSISKEFSLTPYFIRYSNPTFFGSVSTPSTVNIYLNDNLIKSEVFNSGEIEFVNLPFSTGLNEVTVTIKDAYGHEEKITEPFYLSMSLLKQGISEYSYNAGFRRKAIGIESFEYGNPVFLFFHRQGFRENLTAGVRGEAEEGMINLGPTVTSLLGRSGEISTSVAVSRTDEHTGYGGIISYAYAGKHFNSRISIQGFSENYANLSLKASQNKPRFNGTMNIGYGHRTLGSISAAYSTTDNHFSSDINRLSLYYSRRIGRKTSMYVTANSIKSDSVNNDIFAGINFLLGNNVSGGISSQIQKNNVSENVYIQQNPSSWTGWGYRISGERSENDPGDTTYTGNASLQYSGPYGIYNANYGHSDDQNSYNFNMAGGLALIGRSLYPTRTITDGFALVKVGNVENVSVYANNQLINKSDKQGEVLVPNLISNYNNSLSISDTDIPIDYTIHDISKHASVPYRSGGIVRFDVSRLQSFAGYLYFIKKGERIPAEYAGLELKVDEKELVSIVGKGGEFYIENIPAGTYPARLFLDTDECHFDITIPKSDSVLVDIGDISCEIH